MPEQTQDETAALAALMMKKTLFVPTSPAVDSAEAKRPVIAGHLRFMNALEARDATSGPFVQPGVVGDGLSILFDPSEWHCNLLG